MKTITKGLSLAAFTLALSGAAYAAQDRIGWGGPDANASETRVQAQAKAEEMFARFDVNKDGKLDPADRAAKMAAKFDQIDTNRDGAISRDEFAAMHNTMHSGGEGMGAHESAEAPGQDDHRMGMRGMHREGHEGHGGMMMRMADTNKDGTITRQEFVAGALQHFDKVDADHNGTVTPAERKAAFGKMREQMRSMHRAQGEGDMPPPPPSGN